jgi:hypothetical protein
MAVHAKGLTYFGLITGSFVLLAGGIWLYTRHQLWLQGHRLDMLSRVGLIIFCIFVVLMPFHLRYHWETLTPRGILYALPLYLLYWPLAAGNCCCLVRGNCL